MHLQRTILLVDDEPALAVMVERELSIAGYRVLHAASAPEAFALYAQHQPDLMLLDWMLPGMDGLAVLRELRRDSATPVLMLTARGEEADRVIGLELGADDYLAKPFSVRELLARVRALLRRADLLRAAIRADQAAGGAISRGPLRLDPAAHQATLAGAPLDLSPTEFALLHLLLRSPGRAFSRAYLLDTLWGEQYVGGDRSVDNAVMRLRKKIGPLGDAIETVWGVGYRMRAEP
jgi:DNA-binding response OmpR family regulator